MARRPNIAGQEAEKLEPWEAGLKLAREHPLLGSILNGCGVERPRDAAQSQVPRDGWAVVVDGGQIHVHPKRQGTPAEWAYVFGHAALHLAFGHHVVRSHARAWNAACCVAATRFLKAIKFGAAPVELLTPDLPTATEESLYQSYRQHGVPDDLAGLSLAGPHSDDLWFGTRPVEKDRWAKAFASGLERAVSSAIQKAGGAEYKPEDFTRGNEARRWFINHYPLLGALAVHFKIIEDSRVLVRMDISIGAVNPEAREIYLNTSRLDDEQTRFVMAHELLHVGLRHVARRQGRDPFLWNCACDYVINGWLLEMGVGRLPEFGALHDASLAGMSAEAIYDRIVQDLRKSRKLATLRGQGLGDMLEGRPDWWSMGPGIELDELYRRCLAQGLEYHTAARGLLPAGLVEEIRALSMPPVPWDVELARLFDAWFPPLEKQRTYSRPSRRQASTPDIPRPRYALREEQLAQRTFGVVLDTSGSMSRELLAQALGAIASYAQSRDVPTVRVIFCDAAPYDAGYLPAEDIATVPVKVRGRGGTVLQPAIDLLEQAKDFPEDGPVLILTDGECDTLTVKRRHAYVIPGNRWLPFTPSGPVFRINE